MVHRERRKTTMKSAAHHIAHIATVDAQGFPFRKVGALFCFMAAVVIISVHEVLHHGDGHEISWPTWFLLALGGGDLGFQMTGVIMKKFLRG